jgi:hypothetical protein
VRQRNVNYSKAWRDKHRKVLKEVITCECGNTYTRPNKWLHLRTLKHKHNMEIIQITKKLNELQAQLAK